jgi:hypothetical protein
MRAVASDDEEHAEAEATDAVEKGGKLFVAATG